MVLCGIGGAVQAGGLPYGLGAYGHPTGHRPQRQQQGHQQGHQHGQGQPYGHKPGESLPGTASFVLGKSLMNQGLRKQYIYRHKERLGVPCR